MRKKKKMPETIRGVENEFFCLFFLGFLEWEPLFIWKDLAVLLSLQNFSFFAFCFFSK